MTLIDPTAALGVGIHDISDVDDLATDEPATVQRHGDRVILNLSGDAAAVLARTIAVHDATGSEPILFDPWLSVLTRLIIGAALVTDPPAVIPPLPPQPARPGGMVRIPVLGKAH